MERASAYSKIAAQTPWDRELIDRKLEIQQSRVAESLASNEVEPRNIQHQVIILKTQNCTELAERFLVHLQENVNNTASKSKVTVAVLDDSTPRVTQFDYRKMLREFTGENGLDVVYLRVNDQDSRSLIGRLRNRALEIMDSKGATRLEKQKMLMALQILISEELRFSRYPDCDPDNRTDGYIADHYSTVGKGHQSTDNIASLLGAYILGGDGVPLDRGIITHNDDDIIMAGLSAPNGLPEFQKHDYLAEREILFADPETEISAGKYVGVSGSPVRIMSTALEIAVGILDMNRGHIAPNARSPYYIFDQSQMAFRELTVKEALDELPNIIESFLNRAPITGFKISETFAEWLTPHNLRFDQGNYSMIGSLERRVPSPTAGIIEFIQTGVLKTLFRNKDIERAFRIEEPILHVRTMRHLGGNAFSSDILDGAVNRYVKEQLMLMRLYHRPDDGLTRLAQEAYQDSGLTPSLLEANTPNIKDMRTNDLESIALLRKMLEFRLPAITSRDDRSGRLTPMLRRLIDACSDERLEDIGKVWNYANVDEKTVRNTRKNTARFLKAAKYWSFFFDLAYQLGKENACSIDRGEKI